MISDCRKYIRSRLDLAGYKEWSDGFDWENIPKTLLDGAYHILLGQPRTTKSSQDSYEIEVPLTLRIFMSPTGDARALIDAADLAGETVISDLIQIKNRTNYPGMKNLIVSTMDVEPLSESNNNGLVIKIECTALTVIGCR